jgi:hypothetical protein
MEYHIDMVSIDPEIRISPVCINMTIWNSITWSSLNQRYENTTKAAEHTESKVAKDVSPAIMVSDAIN